MAKTYPFSTRKNQHHIEYFRNWCYNNKDNPEYSVERQLHIESCYETATDMILSVQDNMDRRTGVSYLTGEEYAIAKKIIAWAETKRAVINSH